MLVTSLRAGAPTLLCVHFMHLHLFWRTPMTTQERHRTDTLSRKPWPQHISCTNSQSTGRSRCLPAPLTTTSASPNPQHIVVFVHAAKLTKRSTIKVSYMHLRQPQAHQLTLKTHCCFLHTQPNLQNVGRSRCLRAPLTTTSVWR